MMRQGRLVGILLLSLLLTACGPGKLKWKSFPIPIYSESALLTTEESKMDFEDAMNYWESKAGRKLFDYKGVVDNARAAFSGDPSQPEAIYYNIVLRLNPWSLPQNVVGQTTVLSVGDEIRSAMIVLNPEVSFCAQDCRVQPRSTSQRRTFAHELGHFLGMAHTDSKSNIMYPDAIPGGTLTDMAAEVPELLALTED